MAIQSPFKGLGQQSRSISKPHRYTTYSATGAVVSSNSTPVACLDIYDARPTSRSKNPPTMFGSSETKIRYPSDWHRGIASCSQTSGKHVLYDRVSGVRREEEEGFVGHFDLNPFLTVPFDSLSMSGLSSNFSAINRRNMDKLLSRKIHLGTSLAESRKTLIGVARTASRVLRAYSAVKRGKFKRAADILGITPAKIKSGKTFSDYWLEYQYGWRPLISDIYGGIELFKDGIVRRNQLFSVVSQGETLRVLNGRTRNWDVSGYERLFYKEKLFFVPKNQDLIALNQLGLVNPAEVAWELIPFSFVVDWFLPVGSFLQAVTAPLGYQYVMGFRSCRSYITADGVYNPPVASNRRREGSGSFRGHTDAYITVRNKLINLPVPTLRFKSPFSAKHIASFLALLLQHRK